MPFSAVSECLTQSTNTIRRNSTLVQKMIFPIEVLPLIMAVTSMADKLLGLGVLVVVLAVLGYGIHWTLVLLPVLVVIQLLFVMGLSYLFSVVGAYLPDVRETLRAFVRAMFFVTPIIWTVDRVEGTKWEPVVDYNPLAYLVGAYRDVIIYGDPPDGTATFWFTLLAVGLFVAGLACFVRLKKNFADLV
jgi:ABC-type polysaccharide/polyol phosphate export permease